MSERMTHAHAPNIWGGGVEEYGRRTRSEMIAEYRRHHEAQLALATAALAVPDEEIVVETYLGTHARRKLEVVTDE